MDFSVDWFDSACLVPLIVDAIDVAGRTQLYTASESFRKEGE